LDDPVLIIMAAWARGFANHYLGRFREALSDHERVIKMYDPAQHSTLAYVFGMDPAISALAYNGVSYLCLGYPERSQEYMQRALKLARKLDVPSMLAHALTQASLLAAYCEDFEAARERNEALIRVTTEKGVVLFRAWGTIVRGWIVAKKGQHEKGAAEIQRGLEDAVAAGSLLSHPFAQGTLAVALAEAGKLEEGLQHADIATSMCDMTGDHETEAELHRIRGELLLKQDPVHNLPTAEESFRRAIEVARRQHAKYWELRATVSLSLLLRDSGRADEARRLLADVFGWFTEGFDTPDLKRAQALLDELASVDGSVRSPG
jgi:predicted ATPase